MFYKEKYPKELGFSIMIEGLFCRTTDEKNGFHFKIL